MFAVVSISEGDWWQTQKSSHFEGSQFFAGELENTLGVTEF